MSHHHHQVGADKNCAKKDEKNTNAVSKPRPLPLMVKLLAAGFKIVGMVAPKLAGWYAYRLWFKTRRYKTPASERDALHSALIERHKINGQTIVTYQWGQSGPRVLLVHGWSGRGTQLGSLVPPLLAAGYQVLSFDEPAHGASTGKQTNVYEIADVMLALQKHYGNFAAAITHSFGGPCLTTAMNKGLSVLRVVSISPPLHAQGLVNKFIAALSIPKNVEHDLLRRIEHRFGKNVWQEISMQTNVRGLNIPALVLHDMDDHDVSWRDGESVAKAWNNAKFIATQKLGHRRILRDPFAIATAVDFIKAGGCVGTR